ncbi:Hypothetical predicted protein [Octopus vulgaris]|uniref:Uncharacterized protein n=1 Tax=Octopus vulgaris TaxID=6645 RepID=A0AA36BDX8_OCTVU|nr:Hypothetical predicted protein [Octopus vulgaris]
MMGYVADNHTGRFGIFIAVLEVMGGCDTGSGNGDIGVRIKEGTGQQCFISGPLSMFRRGDRETGICGEKRLVLSSDNTVDTIKETDGEEVALYRIRD